MLGTLPVRALVGAELDGRQLRRYLRFLASLCLWSQGSCLVRLWLLKFFLLAFEAAVRHPVHALLGAELNGGKVLGTVLSTPLRATSGCTHSLSTQAALPADIAV